VLAKVGSPYIANYIDLNEDRVASTTSCSSSSSAAASAGAPADAQAAGAAVTRDHRRHVRALAEPHRLGIVHRDLKPDK